MRSERERQSDTDYQNTDHRGAFSVEPRFADWHPTCPCSMVQPWCVLSLCGSVQPEQCSSRFGDEHGKGGARLSSLPSSRNCRPQRSLELRERWPEAAAGYGLVERVTYGKGSNLSVPWRERDGPESAHFSRQVPNRGWAGVARYRPSEARIVMSRNCPCH